MYTICRGTPRWTYRDVDNVDDLRAEYYWYSRYNKNIRDSQTSVGVLMRAGELHARSLAALAH